MPDTDKSKGPVNLKNSIQFIAGILFIGLGIYILVGHFENNTILIWPKKQLFGSILLIYGLVRIVRIYFVWRTQKHYFYEDKN